MKKAHIPIFQPSTPFAVIATRASGYDVFPGMFSTQVTREDMVDGQFQGVLSTILTGVIVPTQDFSASQSYFRSRTVNHRLETYD